MAIKSGNAANAFSTFEMGYRPKRTKNVETSKN